LEHDQLKLRIPFLLVVCERVGLEDDIAEVCGHEEGIAAVVHGP
jgi:hypothetical protein